MDDARPRTTRYETRTTNEGGKAVATMITSGSRGTDDPTMATLPFMAAKTAKEQGHDAPVMNSGGEWRIGRSLTIARP